MKNINEPGKHFISKNQDFVNKNPSYLMIFFLLAFVVFLISGATYKLFHAELHLSRGMGAIQAYFYMDTFTVVMIVAAAIIISSAVVISLYSASLTRKIVVELNFDDDRRELTTRSKNMRGITFTEKNGYASLMFERKRLSDGMTSERHDTIVLYKDRSEVVGNIYRGHFTWTKEKFDEIAQRIRNSK